MDIYLFFLLFTAVQLNILIFTVATGLTTAIFFKIWKKKNMNLYKYNVCALDFSQVCGIPKKSI